MAGDTVYLLWVIGFAVASIGYYACYRDAEISVLRAIAALAWPVGIPIDFIVCDRRWPQRVLIVVKSSNRPSRQTRKRRRRQPVMPDFYNNPPKLGGWR